MSLELKSVNELLEDENGQRAKYWIPAYQRGYRWDQRQVTQLLDDLWDFIQSREEKPKDAFYCLQPLVVKKLSDGRIEVVDGQQRLTTIHILLAHQSIKEILNIFRKQPFEIEYETRDSKFLDEIDLTRADENIDFFHICEAWQAIEKWQSERDPTNIVLLLQHLLNDDEAGRNVKFIWYELDSCDNSIAAFTRLNVGKIPLSETELIRALFLRRAKESTERRNLELRISYEWDQIEKRLQDNAIWYFIQNPITNDETTRIGLVFRLRAGIPGNSGLGDDYRVFSYFAELLNGDESTENVWQSVKDVYMALEEWYEDRYLFHILGFILHQSGGGVDSICELLEDSQRLGKVAFAQSLRERVWRMFFDDEISEKSAVEKSDLVSELCESTYYQNRAQVRKLLLLFNLATLLQDPSSNIRFQFDSFKQETWDIEHIRPLSEERPDREYNQRVWLQQCLKFLQTVDEHRDLAERVRTFLDQSSDLEQTCTFEDIDGEILAIYNQDESDQHDISNLTLLDSQTNRGYQDAIFAVKRHILLERDRAGIYVPLCTRNVFLKCYSRSVGNLLFWERSDAQHYLDEIIQTLTTFFTSDPAIQQ